MKVTWKDNGRKSDLVLVFGHVSAEVIDLGPDPEGTDREFGILTHPFVAEKMVGTRTEAKDRAEAILRGIITEAADALG